MAMAVLPTQAPLRSRRLAWYGLALGYFSYFGLLATLQPYLATLYLEHGVQPGAVGGAVALLYLLAGLSPLTATALAAHWQLGTRKVAVAASLGAAAVALALVYGGQRAGAPLYIVALALLTAGYAPVNAMLDASALRTCSTHGWSFGRLRLMGSLGYILTASGMGRLLPAQAVSVAVHVGIAVLCTTVLACALVLPDAPLGSASTSDAPEAIDETSKSPSPWRLGGLLVACGLHYASFGPFMFGFTLYGQSLGLSATSIGLAWSLGVLSEVGAFSLASAALRRFGWEKMLMVAFVAALVRWTLLFALPSSLTFYVSQLLHGPAFALFYASAMAGLGEVAPHSRSVRSQTLFCALVAGLASGPAMLLAGYASSHLSLPSMFGFILPVNVLSFVILLFATRGEPRRASRA